MDLRSYLREFSQRADESLQIFFANKRVNRPINEKLPYDVVTDMLIISPQYVMGGKKIRGALVQLGYLVGGGKKEQILSVSLAIELVHSFLLVHDDVMDKDEKRRSLKAVHRHYAEKGIQMRHLDSDHYGVSLAIDLGSIMNFWGWELYFSSDLDAQALVRGMKYFVSILEKVGYGQAEDVTWEMVSHVEDKDVLNMYQWKTGEYTIAGPLQLGGILAGVNESVLNAMWQYGTRVGIAFQIRDDELGLYGDENITGKPVGNDVRRGKHTLLKSCALALSSGEDKDFLLRTYGNEQLTIENLQKVRVITQESGACEQVRHKAENLIIEAKTYISAITEDKQLAQVLLELADYVIHRTS